MNGINIFLFAMKKNTKNVVMRKGRGDKMYKGNLAFFSFKF